MDIAPLFPAEPYHPLVVTPAADATPQALRQYLAENNPRVQRLLLHHGGILFRGFNVDEPFEFQECVQSAGARPFGYVGGDSPRSRVVDDVYTSTDYPASEVISLHNEMSYLPECPRRLFFLCETPASSGGQTSLAHCRDVLKALPTIILERFRSAGLNYIRNFYSGVRLGKSWQDTYSTHDRKELEAIVAKQGSTCEWSSNGDLRVSTLRSAFTTHPLTGELVWFNQAEQWHSSSLKPASRTLFEGMLGKGRLPHDCEYGDGTPLDENELSQIRHALNACKLLFDWQRGDLLMIDNILMMHGREAFTGHRRTLAYLSAT